MSKRRHKRIPAHDDCRIPDQSCPYCGYQMDAATPITDEDARPSPGDISLCLRCMEIGIYDDKLYVRKATPAEIEEARRSPAWEKIENAQNLARLMNRRLNS